MTYKCGHCGSIVEHPGVCPTIKATEYYENGTIKRVEYRSAADYFMPFPLAPSLPTGPTTPGGQQHAQPIAGVGVVHWRCDD